MTKRQKFFSALGRFVKNIFTKNILLKVIALLFAILLWGYVLSIENPEYTKRVRDVNVDIFGESTLNARGLMLKTRETGTTDVDVLCRISKHNELDSSKVTCTIDVSTAVVTFDETETSKKVKFPIKATIPTEYGTFQGMTVNSVELEVARISTRSNVQISPKYTGELPEGFTVDVLNNLSISMTGEKAALDSISRGEVTIDLESFPINDPETLANTYDRVLPVQFYDSTGQRLDEIYASDGQPFTVNARIQIRAFKEVDIEPSIEMMEEGYTWQYVLSRSKVVIFGDRKLLDTIDTVKTETIVATATMRNTPMSATLIIPDGTEIAQGYSKSVTVTLSVEELTDTRMFDVRIDYKLRDDGSYLANDVPTTVQIQVTGTLSALETFNTEWVKAVVDLTDYHSGELDLPVIYEISSNASWLKIEPQTETVSVELHGPVTEE